MGESQDRRRKFVTAAFLFCAFMFSFMIRAALSTVAPTLMKLYNISPSTMGYVLSGWNWTYTVALLAAGPVVDLFGPWLTMGSGSLVWGLATLALPLVAAGAISIFLMRMLFGLGQGVLVPSITTSISRLFSPKERATAVAVAFSGNNVGTAISATVAAFVLAHFGWPAVFYVLGGGSLLLTLMWFLFFPDKQIGKRSSASPEPVAQQHVSWFSLLRFRSTWGIALGQMGYLYFYFFFVSWLPGYLIIERKMTLLRTGIYGALPFWAGMFGTLLGGWLGDYLIRRGASPTVSRKGLIGFGLSGAAATVVAAAYVQQVWLCVMLVTISVASLRLATGSANSLPIDLAPRSVVGSLTGIQNFFGNIGGLLAPIVTGYLVASTGSFLSSMVVAGGMALFGAVCYVFVVGNIDSHQVEPLPSAAGARVSHSSA